MNAAQEKPPTIFIHIAACADSDLVQTIQSALASAFNSSRLHFSIANNVLRDEHRISDPFIVDNPQIDYIEVFSKSPLGTGFARLLSAAGELSPHDYSLQVDSHMIFDAHWDKKLIDTLITLEAENNSTKIVLSAFPSAWTRNSMGRPVFAEDDSICIDPVAFNSESYGGVFSNDVPILRDMEIIPGGRRNEEGPVEAQGVSAHFMFSRGSLTSELLHDPKNTWDGDQLNYSMRLLARGYKIYTPTKPVILHRVSVENMVLTNLTEHWRDYYTSRGVYESDMEKFQKDALSGEYEGYWGTESEAQRKIVLNAWRL